MTSQGNGNYTDDGAVSVWDDAVLIRAVRNGDRDAYDTLWRRHSRAAIGFVRPLARSDAEDVVAEAFTSIWEQLQRGVGPSENFRPYLFKVARNITARTYREHQRQLTNIEFEGEPVPGSDESSKLREERREIMAAFEQLPERWQRVLWLTEVEEVPRQRVAEQLSLSPNAVSVLLKRAKEGLRLAWLRRQLPPRHGVEHPEIVDSLPKYLTGALSSRRTRELRAHLSSCATCSRVLEEIQDEDHRLGGRKGAMALLAGVVVLGGGATQSLTSETAASALVGGDPPVEKWHPPSEPGAHPRRTGSVKRRRTSSNPGIPALIGGVLAAAVLLGALLLSTIPPSSQPHPDELAETMAGDSASGKAVGGGQSASRPVLPVDPTDSAESDTRSPDTWETGDSDDTGTDDTQDSDDSGSESSADPEDTDPPALSVLAVDSRSGSVAPRLVGTAQPGSSVLVTIADHRVEAEADEQGAWSTDLAALPLGVGSHEALVAQPELPAVAAQRVAFTLAVPHAELDAWPTEGPEPPTVFPPFVVTFTGIPDAEVCPRPYSQMWGPIALDETGIATTPMFYAWPFQSFGFGYCDGERLGPSDAVPTKASALSAAPLD